MTRKKLPPGIMPRGNRWRIDTFYKGHRIRETCATLEMAEANLRKMQTLIDEDRYLEESEYPKRHSASLRTGIRNGARISGRKLRRAKIRIWRASRLISEVKLCSAASPVPTLKSTRLN